MNPLNHPVLAEKKREERQMMYCQLPEEERKVRVAGKSHEFLTSSAWEKERTAKSAQEFENRELTRGRHTARWDGVKSPSRKSGQWYGRDMLFLSHTIDFFLRSWTLFLDFRPSLWVICSHEHTSNTTKRRKHHLIKESQLFHFAALFDQVSNMKSIKRE